MAERKGSKSTPLDSRAALLVAAKKVFAEKGYEGSTVKDLADEAGVNISLVSYYFGGKEGLYKTCLESFGLERVEASERILKDPTSKEDFRIRVKIFAEGFLDIQQKERDTCKIIQRALDSKDQILLSLFDSVFNRIFLALQNFVAAAQRAGFVKPELDVEITTALMFGSLMHILMTEDIRALAGKRTLDEPGFREALIEHWVNQNTDGVFVHQAK